MRLAVILIGIVLAVGVAFTVYVRTVPSLPAVWHVDPRDPGIKPGPGGYLRREGTADGPVLVVADAPEAALTRFEAIALAQPRVTRLAGSVAERHMTFIARSRVFGFPDYISVLAEDGPEGAIVSVYGRLRFGSSDLGVNRRRVDTWLEKMAAEPS